MNKNMVVFITTSDLSGRSGHNIATNEIVEAFVTNPEIDLILICPKPKFVFSETIRQNAKKIHFFNVIIPRLPFNIFPINVFISQILIINKLKKILSTEDEISFMVARLGGFYFFNTLIKDFDKIPYFLLVRGLSNFRGLFPIKIYNEIDKKCAINNLKKAKFVYVAYDDMKKRLGIYKNENQIKVFNNAVNPKKFEVLSKSNARKSITLGLVENDFVIGFLGSIQLRHHLEDLVLSAEYIYKNMLLNKSKNIKFLIMGDGPLLGELINIQKKSQWLDENNIIFTGFIQHDHVGKYISACDVMYGVVSSATISNPIKCYEYLAAERPIITSRTTDFQFVEKNNLGITLNEVSVSTISEAILELYKKEESELLEMGRVGRKYILNHHNWNDLPKRMIEDYNIVKNERIL